MTIFLLLALIIINKLLSISKHFDDNSYILQYGLLLHHFLFFVFYSLSLLNVYLFCFVLSSNHIEIPFFSQSSFYWDEVGKRLLSLAPLFMIWSKIVTYLYLYSCGYIVSKAGNRLYLIYLLDRINAKTKAHIEINYTYAKIHPLDLLKRNAILLYGWEILTQIVKTNHSWLCRCIPGGPWQVILYYMNFSFCHLGCCWYCRFC